MDGGEKVNLNRVCPYMSITIDQQNTSVDCVNLINAMFSAFLGRPPAEEDIAWHVAEIAKFNDIESILKMFLNTPEFKGKYQARLNSESIPALPTLLGSELQGLNLLVLGTCQIASIVDAANRLGYNAKHMLFESFQRSEIPNIDTNGLDAVVIGFTLRHILADAANEQSMWPADMLLARMNSDAEAQMLLDRCETLFREKLAALHVPFKSLPTFFVSFLEPSFSYLGNLAGRFDLRSPKRFVQRLNEIYANVISEFSNFYFLDGNEIADYVGRMYLQDDLLFSATHASFIGSFDGELDSNRLIPPKPIVQLDDAVRAVSVYGEVALKTVAANLKVLQQQNSVKLVIVDLDDTMWRGVAAEENLAGPERIEGWPLGLVEALLFFKKRGGLLAICSKNDHEPTVKRLSDIFQGALRLDDFASIKINWKAKSENITEILAETNLLAHSTLFIDDNPREIDEVKARHPAIRCLGGNHYDWRRIVMRAPEMQVVSITAESAQRTELVRARVDREVMSKSMPREEWLESLNIEQRFFLVKNDADERFARAFELINKTNQFNTTGKRWQLSEMQKFFSEGGVCLLTSLKDKTVDNGIIGAALISNGEIVQAVLSCRVFGLGAETTMGSMATTIALSQSEKATGRVIDTGKNFSCHNFFVSLGFEKTGDSFEAAAACDIPSWIKASGL